MVPRGQKKQQAWGYRVARLFREVNRRVTYALGILEVEGSGEFPSRHKSLRIIANRLRLSPSLSGTLFPNSAWGTNGD